mgnify:CR=1 FL=1
MMPTLKEAHINPLGFREYDARWLYPKDINKTGIKNVGQGFGSQVILKTNTMSHKEIMSMRPVNWFLYLFWNNGYYVEFMKLIQQLNINPIDFIINFMKNLELSKDSIGNLYQDFLNESENEWYDSPEELFDENSKVINGKLMAENFSKLNAKYTSKVIFGYKKDMAKKLFEVSKNILLDKFGKNYWASKAEHIEDVIRFCSEKSINIEEFKNKDLKDKNCHFIFDYPKWLKNDNGETDIQKFNGGININFYLSKEKQRRINDAIEIHSYENISEVHMKLLEVLYTEDLFYDIGYGNEYPKEENQIKDKGITSWSLES